MTYHRLISDGQIWRCSDPRRFRLVRVVAVLRRRVIVMNIVTGMLTRLDRKAFCTGPRGWSLERQVR